MSTAPASRSLATWKASLRRAEAREREAAVGRRHVLGVVEVLDARSGCRAAGPSCPPRARRRRPAACSIASVATILVGVESELALVVDRDAVEVGPRDRLRGRDAGLHVGAQLADRLLDDVVGRGGLRLLGLGHRRLRDDVARARAGGVVEAADRHRGDVEVVDRADLRRRQVADRRARRRGCSRSASTAARTAADVVDVTRGPSTTKCSSDLVVPGGSVSVFT